MSSPVLALFCLDNAGIVVGFRLEGVRSESCILPTSTFEGVSVTGLKWEHKSTDKTLIELEGQGEFADPQI